MSIGWREGGGDRVEESFIKVGERKGHDGRNRGVVGRLGEGWGQNRTCGAVGRGRRWG